MSMIGLLLVALVALVVIALIILAIRSIGGFGRGHATLNCPHCGVETRTNEGKCDACGKTLV
jgi:hypothetical protein